WNVRNPGGPGGVDSTGAKVPSRASLSEVAYSSPHCSHSRRVARRTASRFHFPPGWVSEFFGHTSPPRSRGLSKRIERRRPKRNGCEAPHFRQAKWKCT